jgi:rubredoxin
MVFLTRHLPVNDTGDGFLCTIEMINSNIRTIFKYQQQPPEVFILTEKYVCAICGHEYNPDKGEPLQNIPPGKEFVSLPEDWVCPVCGVAKRFFNRSCN